MQPPSAEHSKILHWSDITTCVYLIAIVWYLHHVGILFKLGSYQYSNVILLLLAAEIAKYLLYYIARKKINQRTQKNSIRYFIKSLAVITAFYIVFYVTAVCLGAPAFSKYEQTTMFSLILSVFVTVPACLYAGPDKTITMLLSIVSPESVDLDKLLMLKIRLTIFGAWLGAIVIPLDWNRPWQVWPIPCYLGAMAGYAVANFVTSFLQLFYVNKYHTKKTGKYTL